MKKAICTLLIFLLALSLISCNDKAEKDVTDEISIIDFENYLEDNYRNISIDGSTSMIPLHQSLNNLFDSDSDTVEHSKTVDALGKLISGENDILLGVDYSDELLEKAKNRGVELVKKAITREAFVFLINKNNPVQNLTTQQIKDIYSGKITNWSEVGGDDSPITAYQRNSDSGSQMRMIKFMGATELTENNVEYIGGMGYIIEQVSNYDEGKYSIAYNMYTFTEKQYMNDDVVLLSVDGVYPDDESIFNDTYPIIIYNYIYHDAKNISAGEFAENLYSYLMSDEGQQLISDSGYVNLNMYHDRNKDIDIPEDYEVEHGVSRFEFYSEAKGEFYSIDKNDNLLIYTDYADYVLGDSKYKDNEKARELLTAIYESDISIHLNTSVLYEESGFISISPWTDERDGGLETQDSFNYIYEDVYYYSLRYYVDEDKYVLSSVEKDIFDMYSEHEFFKCFSAYADNYITDAVIEITKEDLPNLYIRTSGYIYIDSENPPDSVELEFFQPFK